MVIKIVRSKNVDGYLVVHFGFGTLRQLFSAQWHYLWLKCTLSTVLVVVMETGLNSIMFKYNCENICP